MFELCVRWYLRFKLSQLAHRGLLPLGASIPADRHCFYHSLLDDDGTQLDSGIPRTGRRSNRDIKRPVRGALQGMPQGQIMAIAVEGLGTTIKLYLARAYTGLTPAAIIEAAKSPRGEGETILVVEDDAAVSLLITAVLEELGYRYLKASGAPEAITILRGGARIDLLLTDVGLPMMNGRQLAEFARPSRPEIKVLFVTGYAENAAIRGGFLDRGMDMLTKPFALNVLGSKIREMIGPAS